jgi:hypothetical protein
MMAASEPATMTDRPDEAGGWDGFSHLVLAEWIKLRSVPRWMLTVGVSVGLTVLVALLSSSGSSAEVGEGGDPRDFADFTDELHLVHQPLPGDGSIVAQVVSQKDSHEWAKAGLLVKEDLEVGAPYAAVLVTPDHGVRMQWGFDDDDVAGSRSSAPRWLKLTRSGDTVTGYESADGDDWTEVGAVELATLPQTVEVGLFVSSPEKVTVEIERQFGGESESVSAEPTLGEASFDHVDLDPVSGVGPTGSGEWSDYDGSMLPGLGGSTQSGGVFTLEGSGDIGKKDFGPDAPHDLVQTVLMGSLVGLLAVVPLGVLFITAEYKRDMIRTTFTVTPHRVRALAAKAVVIGGVMLVAGLVAGLASFVVAEPILSSDPIYPEVSLSDAKTVRAIVGTAFLFAVVAVLSLAVATIVRRSAGAIAAVILFLVFPQIVVTGLPLGVANWITRLTPSAGFAVQQTVRRYDTAIGPVAGFGVLCAYTAVALGIAFWQLHRRDA